MVPMKTRSSARASSTTVRRSEVRMLSNLCSICFASICADNELHESVLFFGDDGFVAEQFEEPGLAFMGNAEGDHAGFLAGALVCAFDINEIGILLAGDLDHLDPLPCPGAGEWSEAELV